MERQILTPWREDGAWLGVNWRWTRWLAASQPTTALERDPSAVSSGGLGWTSHIALRIDAVGNRNLPSHPPLPPSPHNEVHLWPSSFWISSKRWRRPFKVRHFWHICCSASVRLPIFKLSWYLERYYSKYQFVTCHCEQLSSSLVSNGTVISTVSLPMTIYA